MKDRLMFSIIFNRYTAGTSGGMEIFMKIGLQELVVVFIVALIVLGPDKLPYYAQKLGQAMKQFKKYTAEATKDIRENIVEPLEEAKRPLKEAMEPINDLNKEINKNINGIKKPFDDLGKPAEKPVENHNTDDINETKKPQEEQNEQKEQTEQKETSEEEVVRPVSDIEVQNTKEAMKIYQEEC